MASALRFWTVKDWAANHSWPSEGGLRHLIFYADKNGFSRVIRRIGRRILLNEQEFMAWVENQKGDSLDGLEREGLEVLKTTGAGGTALPGATNPKQK
jgi:hypothetical protein